MTVVIHRQIGDLKALFLQKSQGIVDGRMLHIRADDVHSGSFIRHGCTNESHVVGLWTAGGK